MNYFENESFLDEQILPYLKMMITNYLEDEVDWAEYKEDLDELEYSNCPQQLVDDIFDGIDSVIKESYNDYFDDEPEFNEEYEEELQSLIENVYDDTKYEIIDRAKDRFEREDMINEMYEDE
jgi:hypothetical protein